MPVDMNFTSLVVMSERPFFCKHKIVVNEFIQKALINMIAHQQPFPLSPLISSREKKAANLELTMQHQ
jgi:hypothetical protein